MVLKCTSKKKFLSGRVDESGVLDEESTTLFSLLLWMFPVFQKGFFFFFLSTLYGQKGKMPSLFQITRSPQDLAPRGEPQLLALWCSDEMEDWLNPTWALSPSTLLLLKESSGQNCSDLETHRTVCSQLVPLWLCIPTIFFFLGGGRGDPTRNRSLSQ